MIFLIYLLLSPSLLLSKNTIEIPSSLTIEKAISIGLNSNDLINSSKWEIQREEENLKVKKTAYFPTLSTSMNFTQSNKIPEGVVSLPPPFPPEVSITPEYSQTYTLHFSMIQPIFTGFRNRGEINKAKWNLREQKSDYQAEKNKLIYEIQFYFYDLNKEIAKIEVINDTIIQYEQDLIDMEQYIQEGTATTNQLLRAQSQLSETKLLKKKALYSIKIKRAKLNQILGLDISTFYTLKNNDASLSFPSPSLKNLQKQAMDNRYEIQAMDQKIKLTQSNINIVRSRYFPQIYLIGKYDIEKPNMHFFPFENKFRRYWDIRINISFPLIDWNKKKHEIEEIKSNVSSMKYQKQNLERSIATSVLQAQLNLDEMNNQLSVNIEILEEIEATYSLTYQQFSQGTALYSDLLAMQSKLMQAKIDVQNARMDLFIAIAFLNFTIGEPYDD